MRNIIIGLIAILVGLGLAVSGWYFRPWSPYSPAAIQAATQPDQLAHTFRNMREVFPYRTIQAGNSADPLPGTALNQQIIYSWDGGDKTLDDWMQESTTTGLMVLHRGEIVHEVHPLGSTPDTLHTSWSVGKSFVATLIAIAMAEGHIDNLDQLAQEFAPQFEGSAYGETSLRHLLMMSAGVDFSEDYAAPDSDIRNFFLGGAIFQRDIDAMVAEVERNRPAGEDLHYVSANTQVLSAVVRAIYNQPLADIVSEKLWQPLGMTHDANWNQYVQSDRGMAIGYCCLNATLADYARMGQFYLQDGVWDGQRILPEGWVQQATRPNAPFQEAGPQSQYRGRGYGLHFWVPENHDGEYFFAGVYGQYIWVDEQREIVIARNAADQEWGARTPETFVVMRALAEAYGTSLEPTAAEMMDASEDSANAASETESNDE